MVLTQAERAARNRERLQRQAAKDGESVETMHKVYNPEKAANLLNELTGYQAKVQALVAGLTAELERQGVELESVTAKYEKLRQNLRGIVEME